MQKNDDGFYIEISSSLSIISQNKKPKFILTQKMQKNLQWIKIEKIWYWWVGLARDSDGKRIIIKWWALPWSVVNLKIVRQKSDYLEAHITEVKKYDKSIVDGEVFCPHFFSDLNKSIDRSSLATVWCGWCKRQMLSYKNQLKLKEDIVKDSFNKLQKNNEIEILPIIGSPLEKNYRNKIEFSFGKYITKNRESKETETLSDRSVGFHKQWEFSKVIDVANCWLISDKANQIYDHMRKICLDSWLPVYDEKTHQWVFRHLVIREWTNTWQILVNLWISDDNIKESNSQKREDFLLILGKDEFLKWLIDTLVITYNNGLANTVRWNTSETKTFRWDGFIYEKLEFQTEDPKEPTKEVSFRVSPFSFFQTNTKAAETLFWQAFKMLWYIKWNILDLYCGTWSIGLSLMKLGVGDKLIWIEIVEEAIVDARNNAKINNIDNVLFLAGPAEKILTTNPELKDKLTNLWLVVIDPPRDGLHKNVVKMLADMKKESDYKLLYISCNPVTMARDIELLIAEWFKVKQIQPVDMFPQTHHIECIWILS